MYFLLCMRTGWQSIEVILYDFMKKFIPRVRSTKPVGEPVRVAGQEPGDVHLHVGDSLHGVQSVSPLPSTVYILWSEELESNHKSYLVNNNFVLTWTYSLYSVNICQS